MHHVFLVALLYCVFPCFIVWWRSFYSYGSKKSHSGSHLHWQYAIYDPFFKVKCGNHLHYSKPVTLPAHAGTHVTSTLIGWDLIQPLIENEFITTHTCKIEIKSLLVCSPLSSYNYHHIWCRYVHILVNTLVAPKQLLNRFSAVRIPLSMSRPHGNNIQSQIAKFMEPAWYSYLWICGSCLWTTCIYRTNLMGIIHT